MRFLQGRAQSWGLLSLALLGGQSTQALDLDLTSTGSIKKAASTVAHGMMTYYKGNETGMPVGLLPQPYYWWEAGAMFGQLVEYWFYTGDDTYNDIVTQGLLAQVGAHNDYMPVNQTRTEGNDDQAFWAFAVLSAIEMKFPDPPSESPSWLSLAQAVFNLQASRWDTDNCGGGLRWQIFTWNNGYDYKNSISNGGFFQLAARLARYTKNQTYADWAEKSYDWILETPLFTDQYQVYDGAHIEDNCTTATKLQWTYNIGTFLMGAVNMYNYTNGDQKWRTRVEGILNGSMDFFPSQYQGNIMVEIACEPQQTCNNDQPSFKAYLSRWMAASTQIAPFTADFINPKLAASAAGAAKQCSGGTDGVTCGRTWNSATWDGKYGPGEQMSALSVIQANLISKVAAPVTQDSGGTSKSDPTAGSQGDDEHQATDPFANDPVSTSDRAGAGILTALVLAGLVADVSTRSGKVLATKDRRVEAKAAKVQKWEGREKRHTHDPSAWQTPPRALFPSGNKAVSKITTSSNNKKRKLSPVKSPPQTSSDNRVPISCCPIPSVEASAAAPSPDISRQLPVLPPHLRLPYGRSPTPEKSRTGSSSPSGAYADLTLDSDGTGNVSGSEVGKGAGSLARLGIGGEAVHSQRLSSRAASPAKRLASAMNDQDGDDGNIKGDLKHATSSTGTEDVARSARTSSKSEGSGQRREVSVEMTDDDTTVASPETSLQTKSTSTVASSVDAASAPDLPPIEEQITKVRTLATATGWMKEGARGYIVANKWLTRVLARGPDSAAAGKFTKEATEGPIGPVDNSSIWLDTDGGFKYEDEKGQDFVFLKPGLLMSDEFEILPQEAWDLIVRWYGQAEGSPTITRYCHNTSTNEFQENLQFELTPPVFTILKLPDTSEGMQSKDLKERDTVPVKILASRSEVYQTFLKRAKNAAGIDLKHKVRVWRIMGGLGEQSQMGQDGMLTPAQSRSNSPAPGSVPSVNPGGKLVLDVNTFAQLQLGSQRELLEAKDETANQNYNGKSSISLNGLGQSEVIVLEEQIRGPAGGEWVSDATTAKAQSNGVAISVTKAGSTSVKDSLKPTAAGTRSTSPTSGGMMTRGRQNKTQRQRGTVGLGNLGNTCYMNSALQCVRSVEELTVYFLEDRYKGELNPGNPLAHGGDVAKSYAKLLHEIYDTKANSSFTPRNFKNVVGKYGPSFSGYQQQDSQEFLLFLLDGLQEDLNRIYKKPYIEKPDSTDEMVNDQVALREMADKCWDIYKKRNDSVITDLFAGMYKSTVVCPVCDKVSIIFDPFNNLTLQLPIQNIWSKDIQFFPLRAPPFKVQIDIDKNAPWSALCDYIAKKVQLDPKRLIVAEIWQHKLYKIFESKKSINEDNVTDADVIGCFELESTPTNWPAQKKQKKVYSAYGTDEDVIPEDDSPMADRMLVSLFNRKPKATNNRYSSSKEFFGVPSLMIVTREEAKDYDAILRRCLSRAETLSDRDFLREEEVAASTEDSDTVILNADDASDGRVHTESLESEDGMVDVSTRNEPDQASNPTDGEPKFDRKPIAPMLKPGSFITPAARHLFEIKTFSTGSEMVPIGFQTFISDDDKKILPLASRVSASSGGSMDVDRRSPHLSTKSAYQQRISRTADSPPTSDEDEGLPPAAPLMQPNSPDEGSDSDGLPPVAQIYQQTVPTNSVFSSNRRNSRNKNTYSKKEKRRAKFSNSNRQSPSAEEATASDQMLLHLGECLVLDWTDEGYDALFGGLSLEDEEAGPSRGHSTFEELRTFEDPDIAEKRKQRATRRKNGFSLGDCLDEFGKPEILSENDAWYCPRCKEHRRASKTFELWKAPDILVIHLKRFSAQGRFNNKLDVLVDYPLEGLDLSSRLATKAEDGKSPVYDLFAVDNHYGGLGGGHYTAYAKNFYDKRWYEYNDSFVSPRKDESVVTSAGYLLFYRRQTSTVLGGPFFEQFWSDPPKSQLSSQANSRAPSPSAAGEGRRLDDSSRNGSSSASHAAGVAHQAGGGGAQTAGQIARGMMTVRNDVDVDELPPYETVEMKDIADNAETLEGMEVDEDEGIGMGMADSPHTRGLYDAPAWSFNNLNNHDDDLGTHIVHQPPPNSDIGEGDNDSVQVGGGSTLSDGGDRMAAFADDEGTIDSGALRFETPPPEAQLGMDPPWDIRDMDYEDAPVKEVILSPPKEDEGDEEVEGVQSR